jgi:predicted membrane-bound mannosyltransferase
MHPPWLSLNAILTLALLAVVRLGRAQRRYRGEVQVRLATMAALPEQSRRGDFHPDNGLTPAEGAALAAPRRRAIERPASHRIGRDRAEESITP